MKGKNTTQLYSMSPAVFLLQRVFCTFYIRGVCVPNFDKASDERELLDAVCRADDVAFAVLLERCMPMIRQETARFRHHLADQDDLAQEAALGLLAAAKAYRVDGGASFVTFARVCVRRRLINVMHAMPHEDDSGLDLDSLDDAVLMSCTTVTDPDTLLVNKEAEYALLEHLKQLLSDIEYRVLVLHLASYSYREMAESLNIPQKAVDNALQRIRRKLKKAL